MGLPEIAGNAQTDPCTFWIIPSGEKWGEQPPAETATIQSPKDAL